MSVRVAIVEDHPVVTRGLLAALGAREGMENSCRAPQEHGQLTASCGYQIDQPPSTTSTSPVT